jgi:isopenicillin N synthase-like dioxygenase
VHVGRVLGGPYAWSVANLPIIDLAPFAKRPGHAFEVTPAAERVAGQLDQALCETGFVLLANHGVDPDTKALMLDRMHAFFSLPDVDRQALSIAHSPAHRGYVGIAKESLDDGNTMAGDLKETLDTGPDHGADHPDVIAGTPLHGPNQMPEFVGFREAFDAYRAQVISAAERAQRAMAMALGCSPDALLTMGDVFYNLRLIHYPATDKVTPQVGQLGCGAHTDYGSLTVLADDGVGGLQVMQRNGSWVDVEVPDDLLVMNLGDLMAIWTNDRWVSNPHRVVNPVGRDRYSMPLFVTPPYHSWIECLPSCVGDGAKYAPMQSGPYLLSRFDATHSYRNELLAAYNAAT